MSNLTARSSRVKPAKPHKEFPLFPHATGRWAKKVRGKIHYFGPWDHPDAALDLWLAQKDDLLAGRKPRDPTGRFTIRDLVNHFLTFKQNQYELGEITKRTFDEYHTSCETLVRVFGKTRAVEDLRADDFDQLRRDLAKSRSAITLHNEIGRIRVVFNFAYQNYHVERPVRYGVSFKRPSRRVLRIARAAAGPKMFEPDEIHKLFDAAGTQMQAMILLGVNGGLGNADVGNLELRHCDVERGWLDYPRPKTGVARRIPLSAETKEALNRAIAERKEPTDEADANIVFVTKYGARLHKESRANPLSAEFRKLSQKVNVYRKGTSFYGLRHTFETIGGDSKDQVAVNAIMGHVDESMAGIYRERVSDERLLSVVGCVHTWLFG